MKILFISRQGDGAPIAENFQREGHEVRMWIKKPEKQKGIFDGILTKAEEWKPSVSWCDFAYVDHTGLGDIADQIRKTKPVFGGSKAAEDQEANRTKAHDELKKRGILCPESISVKTIEEARKHIQKHHIKHVLKPVGPKCHSEDVFLSRYEDGWDAISILDQMEKQKKEIEYIEIEERIDGLEAGVAGYFDGSKFGECIEINFQMKRFATGNFGNGMGPMTGEMGTITKMVGQDNPFFKNNLEKIIPWLKSIDYRGEIDMGFIVNQRGAYFTEYTVRKGYPDCVIRLETQKTPDAEVAYQIAKGNLSKYECSSDWAIGVVVVCLGFYNHKSGDEQSQFLPILGYEENKEHCRLFGAMKIDGKYMVSGDSDAYPLVVTGHGKTIEEAQRNVYWLVDERNPQAIDLNALKAWVRTDIGERVLRAKNKIIQYGILTKADFGGIQNAERSRDGVSV